MFNNNYDKHPYFQYNFELYPSREQQLNFLNAYIEQYKKSIRSQLQENADGGGGGSGDGQVDLTDKENIKETRLNVKNLNIEHMIVEANYFALCSHLFWANWAVCQAAVCKIKFEYLVSVIGGRMFSTALGHGIGI
jgi:choline/ethanolamine kinase